MSEFVDGFEESADMLSTRKDGADEMKERAKRGAMTAI